jgi:hypothetical protein
MFSSSWSHFNDDVLAMNARPIAILAVKLAWKRKAEIFEFYIKQSSACNHWHLYLGITMDGWLTCMSQCYCQRVDSSQERKDFAIRSLSMQLYCTYNNWNQLAEHNVCGPHVQPPKKVSVLQLLDESGFIWRQILILDPLLTKGSILWGHPRASEPLTLVRHGFDRERWVPRPLMQILLLPFFRY